MGRTANQRITSEETRGHISLWAIAEMKLGLAGVSETLRVRGVGKGGWGCGVGGWGGGGESGREGGCAMGKINRTCCGNLKAYWRWNS